MWEDRNLSDLTDADVRLLVESGVGEHLRLEYKRELYGNRDADHREFLQDICMFANAGGGILLIGIDEQRSFDLMGVQVYLSVSKGSSQLLHAV